VLDPFIGSGTTAIAALETERQFIGFEKNVEYCDIAKKRIFPYLGQQKINKYTKVVNNG
jgi:DNA modification methylase